MSCDKNFSRPTRGKSLTMIANGLSKNNKASGRQSLYGGSIYFGCQAGTTPYGCGPPASSARMG
jgi:hypothetical protein